MGERDYSGLERRHESRTLDMRDIVRELHEQRLAFTPTPEKQGDIIIASFCKAAVHCVSREPMKSIVEEYAAINPGDSPSYAVNKLLRAPQKQLLFNDPNSNYPDEQYENPDTWLEVLPKIFAGEKPYDRGALMFDLYFRPAAANISERYKGVDLVLGLKPERFDEPAVVWDVGCSLNRGINHMKRQKEIPFEDFKVVRPIINHDDSPEITAFDPENTRFLHSALGRVATGRAVGVDVMRYFWTKDVDGEKTRMVDTEAVKAARSASFYPMDLRDEKKVVRYRELEKETEGVEFVNADFSDDPEKLALLLPPDSPNAVVFSTVLYQKPVNMPLMVENAKRFVDKNGLVIVQDFMCVDGEDSNRLHTIDSWFARPFSYRTFVLDMHRQKNGFMEVFKWKNGRCTEVILGKDFEAFRANS